MHFDDHARSRMALRNISKADIAAVLLNYYFSCPAANSGTQLWGIGRNGKELKVWINGGLPISRHVIIRTAVWRGEN
jgi:hypothetical protein